MRRELSLRSPPASDAAEVHPVEPAVEQTVSPGPPLAERLTSLTMEARQEWGARRTDVVDSLNALLEGLASHPAPEQVVPTVHRLLEEGLLDGLQDHSGQGATVAATRALLSLGYPHALEVSPEQLEALRRWENRTHAVPWGLILGILFVAAVLQLFLVTLGSPGIRLLFGASVDALAGEPVEVTLAVRLQRFWYAAEYPVFFVQQALNGGAWLLTLIAGGLRDGRRRARRLFYGLGALGLLVGAAQFPFLALGAMGTFVSAGAALLAGWLLREK